MMRAAAILAACLVFAACGQQKGAPAADAGSSATGIAWIEGDVETALARAASEERLVFLYWGATWCPPCHDLDAHVFSRPDFQQKIRQFVAVHLDGDSPGAQRLAQQFNVLGYPTAVVLRPDGTEVARIAGGMDLTLYADVLDLALDNVRPLPTLLAELSADDAVSLDAADCRRLAYNGWTLDPVAADNPAQLVRLLLTAAARCPAAAITERDRLVITAAGVAAEAHLPADGKSAVPLNQLTATVDAVVALLPDRQRGLANADALLALGEEFFQVLRQLKPDTVPAVQSQWFALMDAIETDPRYAEPEQLMSAAGRLTAARALAADDVVPAAAAQRARTTLDAFLARDYDVDARAGVVNSASWVLTLLGDDARLRSLLEGEIRTSRTPYYYMPDIADIDERAGRIREALEWLERGYRESRGPATRFQWGVLYVEGLLRMTPQDDARIREATLAVIGELEGPDRIHARARTRLVHLDSTLRAWSQGQTAHAATVKALAARWQQICGNVPAGDPARQDCPALLLAGRG